MPVQFAKSLGYHRLESVSPFLHGCYFRQPDGSINIPVLNCLEPGQGYVSRFLDNLPPDERIMVTCVVSPILRGALGRRGWVSSEGGMVWTRPE